jgi:GNAT superfamily N-acetyltransferase
MQIDALQVTGPPRVRPGCTGDVRWMMPLWTTMMQQHARHSDAFALADDAAVVWQKSMWEMMARRDSFVLVSEPLGFCCGWVAQHPAIYRAQNVGLVSEICVADGAQRMGVGKALMAAAGHWFALRELNEFQLATAMFNTRAQAFFVALGGAPLLMRYRFLLPD